jgi:hypothetical protein
MTTDSIFNKNSGASPLDEFCARNSIGKTTAYAEIAAGRLIARKCRGKTLILFEDEAAWRQSLPKFESRAA